MRRLLQKRLRALEDSLLPGKAGGPLVALLPEGMTVDEFRATLKPWYTPSGQPRKPVIVLLDERDPNPTPMSAEKGRLLRFSHVEQGIDMGEDL